MKSRAILMGTLLGVLGAGNALAVTSAEVYTNQGYQYGRFAARMQFAPGSGVVSSFFLWKDGSEKDDVFWNELDFEKLETECRLETNTIYGDPEGGDPEKHALQLDMCGAYHVYAYEWTPEYIAWSIDGVEIRRDTGDAAIAYRDNTADGMQLRFNVWPGDSSFGGDFDPAILPVYEYIDWVEYSSYANGVFQVDWREDFTDGQLPSGWSMGSWDSPKGLSTHSDENVGIKDGYIVLALTADEATGFAGANPLATDPQPQPDPSATASVSQPGQTSVAPATDATSAATTSAAASTTAPVDTAADPTNDAGCTVGASSSSRAPVSVVGMALACALALFRGRRAPQVRVQAQTKGSCRNS